MPDTDGLVSCVGGCNSKLFNSRRVHRPLVDNNSQANIHLLQPRQAVLEKSEISSNNRHREALDIPPVFLNVPNVKKSRKRRDRKASGTPQVAAIRIEHHSDDDEETPKRSRPLAVRFMFWFCGIWIVIVGAGALLYAIAILCTSMDKVTKFFQTVDKKRMLTDSWRTKEFFENKKKDWS